MEERRSFNQVYTKTMQILHDEGFIRLSYSSSEIAALRDALPEDCVRIYSLRSDYCFRSPREDLTVSELLCFAQYLRKNALAKTLRQAIRDVLDKSESDVMAFKVLACLTKESEEDYSC